LVGFFAGGVFAVALSTAGAFVAVFFVAVFFVVGAFFVTVFFVAGAFLAVAFFAAVFFVAGAFLAVAFFAAVFFAPDFTFTDDFAIAFPADDLVAADFFAGVFFAAIGRSSPDSRCEKVCNGRPCPFAGAIQPRPVATRVSPARPTRPHPFVPGRRTADGVPGRSGRPRPDL
jgi:hypothetical protein